MLAKGRGSGAEAGDGPERGDCPECLAPGTRGREGCDALFRELIGRELSRPELFRVHSLTVDAYSLQHPDRYMRSVKSAAAHLTSMCWSLDEGPGPDVSRGVSRWLDGDPSLTRLRPPEPGRRGAITIRWVYDAPESADHVARVREWARSAWAAWAPHHDQTRAWTMEARMPGRRNRRAGE